MFSRRDFVAAFGAAAAAYISCLPSAHAQQKPEALISELGAELLGMLKVQSREQREAHFRGLLLKGVDVDLLAAFSLGRYRGELKPEQRVEYRRLFEDFLVATYVSRLGLFSGETFTIRTTQKISDTEYFVQTLVQKPDSRPIRLDWRLRGQAERYKIIDVMVEGISMAVTQQQEFVAVIQSNGGRVDALLDRLRQYGTN